MDLDTVTAVGITAHGMWTVHGTEGSATYPAASFAWPAMVPGLIARGFPLNELQARWNDREASGENQRLRNQAPAVRIGEDPAESVWNDMVAVAADTAGNIASVTADAVRNAGTGAGLGAGAILAGGLLILLAQNRRR